MTTNAAAIEMVASWLASSRSAVVLTGAGISTESGIPDFRSPGGVWSKYRTVYYDEFLESADARYEYWRQKCEMHREFAYAQPNVGHQVLARWEASGCIRGVITQNIDGLHQIAGSGRVLELHGTARQAACIDCRARYEIGPLVEQFLAQNRVGVTISIDGPKEVQDQFRVFANGTGSYDIVMPKIRELLRRHRTRPVGARVTLTTNQLDIRRIFQHLTEEVGFWEVGFAPVTTAPNRDYAIAEDGFDSMLRQFQALAADFLEAALQGRHHGFSNVKDTLEEIHKGVSKPFPCGAGLGLLGVSTDGDVALCHRFAGSDAHKLGTVRTGIDRLVQIGFLEKHHIADKTDCSQCWARPMCAGGCYHEAHTRYGDTARPNLHYCEWIRAWTDTCLRIYGELSARNPGFLEQFDDKVEHETSQVS